MVILFIHKKFIYHQSCSPLDQRMAFLSDIQVWIFFRNPSGISLLSFKSSDLRIASEGGRSETMLSREAEGLVRTFLKKVLSFAEDRAANMLFSAVHRLKTGPVGRKSVILRLSSLIDRDEILEKSLNSTKNQIPLPSPHFQFKSLGLFFISFIF
jgi:hypothetical protein